MTSKQKTPAGPGSKTAETAAVCTKHYTPLTDAIHAAVNPQRRYDVMRAHSEELEIDRARLKAINAELLAALQILLASVNGSISHVDECDQARAAIAKATA